MLNSKLSKTSVFSIAIAILVLTLSYLRLYFGVNFTDEAYYVALPYRFVLGDKAFVDEVYIYQTMALLSYPFLHLYYWIVGSSNGIMLFARHLYLLFMLIVSRSIFIAMKEYLEKPLALLVSLLPFAFLPFNIATLSYNSFAYGFLTIGIFLLLKAHLGEAQLKYYVLSGVAHSLCFWSYPTLSPLSVVIIAMLIFTYKSKASRAIIIYICTNVAVLLILCLLYKITPQKILNSYEFMTATLRDAKHYYHFQKYINVLRNIWIYSPSTPILALGISGVYFSRRSAPKLACFLLCLWPFFLYFSMRVSQQGLGAQGYILYSGFMALILYQLLKKEPGVTPLFNLGFLCSAIAGLAIGFSSGIGLASGCLGFFPAAVMQTVFALRLLKNWSGKNSFGYFFISSNLLLLILYQRSTFQDRNVNELSLRVNKGPFMGLYTNPEKLRFLEEFTRELEPLTHKKEGIVFYPHFPAGYLFTALKPLTPSVWSDCHMNVEERCVTQYRQLDNQNSLAVLVKGVNESDSDVRPNTDYSSALHSWVLANQALKNSHPVFLIYAGAKTP